MFHTKLHLQYFIIIWLDYSMYRFYYYMYNIFLYKDISQAPGESTIHR